MPLCRSSVRAHEDGTRRRSCRCVGRRGHRDTGPRARRMRPQRQLDLAVARRATSPPQRGRAARAADVERLADRRPHRGRRARRAVAGGRGWRRRSRRSASSTSTRIGQQVEVSVDPIVTPARRRWRSASKQTTAPAMRDVERLGPAGHRDRDTRVVEQASSTSAGGRAPRCRARGRAGRTRSTSS